MKGRKKGKKKKVPPIQTAGDKRHEQSHLTQSWPGKTCHQCNNGKHNYDEVGFEAHSAQEETHVLYCKAGQKPNGWGSHRP